MLLEVLGFVFKAIGCVIEAIVKPLCASFDLILKTPVYFR